MKPEYKKIIRICIREGCNHLQDSHPCHSQPYSRPKCEEDGCQCPSFVHAIRVRNKDFPGPNQKIVLGRQAPPTDLGTNQDLLLAGCIKTIMRLCKHINVTPAAVVEKAWKAIKEEENEMSTYCSHCQLQWSQRTSDHLYGCEVDARIKAKEAKQDG